MALLPQIGSAQQFAEARRLLRNLHYDEESVCARLGISAISQFQALGQGRTTGVDLNDGLDALIRLLLDGEGLSELRMRYLLTPEAVAALESLGMIVRMGSAGDFYGLIRLSPIESLYIASDRNPPIDPEIIFNRSEIVFDPISWNTGVFLKHLPRQECESLLDLCCGSAVEALVCAPVAKRVWASDVASRSLHFAEYNCRLNGIGNVGLVQTDLYAAFRGKTFDRIVAHPPYVPDSGEETLLYRDGGDDGEQILCRIIEGLPVHLRPGGLFYAFVMTTDREGCTFTDRLQKWLGSHSGQFDISLKVTGAAQMKPYEHIRERLKITNAYCAAVFLTRKA